MANATGVKRGIDAGELIETWLRNGCQTRATAKALGCDPANVTRRLRKLYDAGDHRIDPAKLFQGRMPVSRTFEEINRARIELGMRAEAKTKSGDWRSVSMLPRIKSPVFILGLFGDPHLDNPGTDLDLFEQEIQRLDASQHVHGVCIGDMFDNWVRALAFAGQSSTDPYAAWIVFEDMMDHNPLDALVLGNHDVWNSGTANVLVEFCRARGIVVRRSGATFLAQIEGCAPLTIAARHQWRGNSMYSEAHSLKRAAMQGHTDADILVGGHFHQGENRTHVRPHDGRVSKLVMLDAFKRLDDYANDRGFMSADVPPVVWVVCDARLPLNSHERVQPFYDFSTARAVHEYRRGRN